MFAHSIYTTFKEFLNKHIDERAVIPYSGEYGIGLEFILLEGARLFVTCAAFDPKTPDSNCIHFSHAAKDGRTYIFVANDDELREITMTYYYKRSKVIIENTLKSIMEEG